jgi:hypothetical protein
MHKKKLKEILTKAKDKAVEKSKAAWAYTKDVATVIRENKAVSAAVLIGIATVGSEGYRAHANGKTITKQAEEFDCRVDTNDGQHLHTCKPMNADEREQLTRRQRAGEDTTVILKDMRLM